MFKVLWDAESLGDVDANIYLKIKKKVDTYLAKAPKELGKPLSGVYKGLYRYRYGDYRIIYEILPKEETIIILKIGHRRKVYSNPD